MRIKGGFAFVVVGVVVVVVVVVVVAVVVAKDVRGRIIIFLCMLCFRRRNRCPPFIVFLFVLLLRLMSSVKNVHALV